LVLIYWFLHLLEIWAANLKDSLQLSYHLAVVLTLSFSPNSAFVNQHTFKPHLEPKLTPQHPPNSLYGFLLTSVEGCILQKYLFIAVLCINVCHHLVNWGELCLSDFIVEQLEEPTSLDVDMLCPLVDLLVIRQEHGALVISNNVSRIFHLFFSHQFVNQGCSAHYTVICIGSWHIFCLTWILSNGLLVLGSSVYNTSSINCLMTSWNTQLSSRFCAKFASNQQILFKKLGALCRRWSKALPFMYPQSVSSAFQ